MEQRAQKQRHTYMHTKQTHNVQPGLKNTDLGAVGTATKSPEAPTHTQKRPRL